MAGRATDPSSEHHPADRSLAFGGERGRVEVDEIDRLVADVPAQQRSGLPVSQPEVLRAAEYFDARHAANREANSEGDALGPGKPLRSLALRNPL